MKIRLMIAVLLLTAMMVANSRAGLQGPGSAQGRVQVQGWVPVVCRADLASLHTETASSGLVRLVGTLDELCNGAGYQVWLEHAPGVEGVAIVDNAAIAIDPSGRTLISQSARPEQRKRALALHFKTEPAPTSVSVRLQPSL